MSEVVAILGASPKADRFSNKALHLLQQYGHEVLLVNPVHKEIDSTPVYPSLAELPKKVDTLTLYVGAPISTKAEAEILKLNPRRVIFNPGAENSALAKKLQTAGIKTIEACTLVLLRANQF
jgi:predicted CoA-binding protein